MQYNRQLSKSLICHSYLFLTVLMCCSIRIQTFFFHLLFLIGSKFCCVMFCSILLIKCYVFLFLFRHESYRTQYRAMFVMNCTVIKEEILKYKGPLNKKTKRRRHKKTKQSSESIADLEKQEEEEEIYHPVKCTECSTEVAVWDKDEVFHFFNVLASHC